MCLASFVLTSCIWFILFLHIHVLFFPADVRTQAMYQLLDSGFIGLVFSCFSEDANKVSVWYELIRKLKLFKKCSSQLGYIDELP